MTTDTQLRDLLAAEAGGPAGARGWDDVVRRGRHRRRVRRVRAMAGVALVAGVAATALALADDDPTVETVPPASDPTNTTVTDGRAGTSSPELPFAFRIPAFRAQGVFLTVAMLWDGPLGGFDPCTDLHPRVIETSEQISVELVGDDAEGELPWADCGTGHMGSWGTIVLEEPVGARTVNGRAVIDGASLLLPTELPAPFDLERREEAAALDSVPDENGFLTEVWSWSFSWRAGMSELRLSIDSPPTSDECDGESEDIEVRGTTARLCRGAVVGNDGVGYGLQWEEDGRPITISYASIDPDPLTLDGVLSIAEGLEPLGG
jgi:hypothetical protein